jgi:polysaccharide biosynthesis/export protein
MFRIIFVFCIGGMLTAQQGVTGLSEREPRYRVQPNDVLAITYRYTPEFNQTVSVEPDGFVSLELTGDVKVEGLTLDEVRLLVTKRSEQRLLDPEISVVLKDYDKPHFVVAGEVANPGRFDLHGRVTALEAVAMAGGLKVSAKNSQAILYRRVGPEMAETRLVNLKEIATLNGMKEDFELKPGDLLYIPQSRISKVERFVKWGSWGLYANPLTR